MTWSKHWVGLTNNLIESFLEVTGWSWKLHLNLHYLGAVGRFHPCQHLILVAPQLEHTLHSHSTPGPPREIQVFELTLTTCKYEKIYCILDFINSYDSIMITEIFRHIQHSSYRNEKVTFSYLDAEWLHTIPTSKHCQHKSGWTEEYLTK